MILRAPHTASGNSVHIKNLIASCQFCMDIAAPCPAALMLHLLHNIKIKST